MGAPMQPPLWLYLRGQPINCCKLLLYLVLSCLFSTFYRHSMFCSHRRNNSRTTTNQELLLTLVPGAVGCLVLQDLVEVELVDRVEWMPNLSLNRRLKLIYLLSLIQTSAMWQVVTVLRLSWKRL